MPSREKPPCTETMRQLGLNPDPWQIEVFEGGHQRLLLNCCRQAGKSTTVALLALAEAVWVGGTQVLLLSRSFRQSQELFKTVIGFYKRLGRPARKRQTAGELELDTFSRIVCLPCKEDTIRGFSNIDLLIIDEAARVPDDLYRAVSPMLAVSNGRMICLSTPHGKRGFFYDAWANGGADWHRIEVAATGVPRITPAFLEKERRALGESWFRQEYCCSFEALEGLVFPDFGRALNPGPPPEGTKVGGMDFGVRNPFAALWGVLDRDNILWITGEHYSREKSLAYHREHLPKGVTWYADPQGSREILELRSAGLTIRKADNDIRPGIAAVRARLEDGTLKVLTGATPNLIAEAGLYRYDSESGKRSENPIKEFDHALDALRYLISKIDFRRMAKIRKDSRPNPAIASPKPPGPGYIIHPEPAPRKPAPPKRKWLSIWNEALWTPISFD